MLTHLCGRRAQAFTGCYELVSRGDQRSLPPRSEGEDVESPAATADNAVRRDPVLLEVFDELSLTDADRPPPNPHVADFAATEKYTDVPP